MSQLIPGGQCGPVLPRVAGPHYPLACPQCGEAHNVEFGRADDLAYGTEHHGDRLSVVEVPVACGGCGQAYTLHLVPGVLGGLVLAATYRSPKGSAARDGG